MKQALLSTRGLAVAAALLLLGLAPRAAQACSVCSAGRDDETRTAFLATTLFLSVLPLVLVGVFLWWARRRARELDRAREVEEARLPASASPARNL